MYCLCATWNITSRHVWLLDVGFDEDEVLGDGDDEGGGSDDHVHLLLEVLYPTASQLQKPEYDKEEGGCPRVCQDIECSDGNDISHLSF